MKNYSLLIVWIALAYFASPANSACVTAPDMYTMGTGVNVSGLCTAVSTGETALSVSEIAGSTSVLAEGQYTGLLKQAEQYAKQIEEVQNLVIQTEMMIKDLEENPFEVVTPDINRLIANQKRIEKLANEIEKNSSQVGSNLVNNLAHPNTIGLGQGSRFALWSEARRRNVEESYAKVIQFIKDSKPENESINKSIKNISTTQDKTATLKVTGNIAGQQLGQMHKMTELLNQLLGAQAVNEGAKLEEEMAAQKALHEAAISSHAFQIESDTYKGPGKHGTAPF